MRDSASSIPSTIPYNRNFSEVAQEYLSAMLQCERHRAVEAIDAAVNGGIALRDIYLSILQPVQYEIGALWQAGRISVAQEHYCTNATQVIMASLYPRLFTGKKGPERLLAACVQGELHELGLRMVADLFELEGWNTDFIGANTPSESILAHLEATHPQVLAIGVTMHYHLERALELIRIVRERYREKIWILVGGYSLKVNDGLWRSMGADGSAIDALEAIALANKFVGRGVH